MSTNCETVGTIEWSQVYELGYPMIDGEHRYLVQLVNRATVAIAQHDVSETQSLLGRFVAACQFHFWHEEQIMIEIGFDDIEGHVAYHGQLLSRADDLLDQCQTTRDIDAISAHFSALTKCLLDDVISGDKALVPFLEAKGMLVP